MLSAPPATLLLLSQEMLAGSILHHEIVCERDRTSGCHTSCMSKLFVPWSHCQRHCFFVSRVSSEKPLAVAQRMDVVVWVDVAVWVDVGMWVDVEV